MTTQEHQRSNSAVLRDGDITVVLEGVARLHWSHRGPDEWLLCGLWPNSEEQRAVIQRLTAGHPLLVVLEHRPATVSVYRREVMTELDQFENVIDSDPLLELAVPVFDWLPEPLAIQGRTFVAWADELVRTTAGALLPALVTDGRVDAGNLRFARRTAQPVTTPECLQAARQVFASRTIAASDALVAV